METNNMIYRKSIVKAVLKKLTIYVAKIKLNQLGNIQNPAADKIANAINDTLINKLTPEEKELVERIEKKRSELNNSLMEITITDYGAGSPNKKRNKDQMYEGVVTTTTVSNACKASKSYFWSLVLFKLIREFKPTTCIELGAGLGISGAYQASALKLNNKGNITTLEGAKSLASLAKDNFQQLGLENVDVVIGRFQDNLGRILTKKVIDYAFIDGHHDEEATISYFEQFFPYLSQKSLLIFDDISWSDGMRRA